MGGIGNRRLWVAQFYLIAALFVVIGLTVFCCVDFTNPESLNHLAARLDWHCRFFWWIFVILLFALLLFLRGFLELRDFLKEKDDFIRACGHDLLTPIVGLRATIGIDDVEAKLLNERLFRLVDNLRSFVRMGSRRPPSRETFMLGEAFGEAYVVFAADYRELLGNDVHLDGDAEIVADRTLVVQILWNLLGNALKYAAPFGNVCAAVRNESNRVILELSDTGPGMSSHTLRHAFDRYYRSQTAIRSGQGGFGIGLCVAREFARSMGAELSVRPNSPQGCIFSLVFPILRS